MAKSKDQKETQGEREMADVARQQIADFETRWRPQQQRQAAAVVDAAAPGSTQRARAETVANAEAGAAFGAARQNLNKTAAASGQFGTTGHKLALAGMDNDQATSSGLATVVADQAADDAYVGGLEAVTAIGRGEKATAIGGLQQTAASSAAQARADAGLALERRIGNAQLVGQAAGVGAGLYAATPGQTARNVDAANRSPDPMGTLMGLQGARYAGPGRG